MNLGTILIVILLLHILQLSGTAKSGNKKVKKSELQITPKSYKRKQLCIEQGHTVRDKKTKRCPAGYELIHVCCVKCTICEPGFEKNADTTNKCFASCTKCIQKPPYQYYSNADSPKGTEKCTQCIYCSEIYRTTISNCTPTQNSVCGSCEKDYVPLYYPDSHEKPCKKDLNIAMKIDLESTSTEREDIQELNMISATTTETTIDIAQLKTKEHIKSETHWQLNVVAVSILVLLVLAIGMGAVCLYKRCKVKKFHHYPKKQENESLIGSSNEDHNSQKQRNSLADSYTVSFTSLKRNTNEVDAIRNENENSGGSDRTYGVNTHNEVQMLIQEDENDDVFLDIHPAQNLRSVEEVTSPIEAANRDPSSEHLSANFHGRQRQRHLSCNSYLSGTV